MGQRVDKSYRSSDTDKPGEQERFIGFVEISPKIIGFILLDIPPSAHRRCSLWLNITRQLAQAPDDNLFDDPLELRPDKKQHYINNCKRFNK